MCLSSSTMDPSNRPVVLRTSTSAEDFWCRLRDSAKVSPHNFKERNSRDTPYGRQNKPNWGNTNDNPETREIVHSERAPPRLPLIAVPTGLTNSRIVERQVYKNALAELDIQKTPVPSQFVQQIVRLNTNLDADMKELKRKNEALEKRLMSALKVNKALAAQMSEMHTT